MSRDSSFVRGVITAMYQTLGGRSRSGGSARGSTDVLLHEACGDTRQRERPHRFPRLSIEDQELGRIAPGHQDLISPTQRTAVGPGARALEICANDVTAGSGA